MAWMMVLGDCIICGRPFTFNATKVPSINRNGVREPVCQSCMTLANARRREEGLAPLPILPGAYDPEQVETDDEEDDVEF